MQDFEQLNKDVLDWAKYQSQRLKRQVAGVTLKDKHAIYKSARLARLDSSYKPLEKSIGSNLKKDFGAVSRINFRFSKQGIWLEHGVGKGRNVRTANARPKPWLANTLDPAIDKLADLVAKNYADIAGGEIKFFIPGILDRRVTISNNG